MAKDEPPGETGTEIRLQEKMIKDSSRLGGCGKAKEPPNRKEGVTKMRNNPRRVILSGKPDMAAPHPLITLGSSTTTSGRIRQMVVKPINSGGAFKFQTPNMHGGLRCSATFCCGYLYLRCDIAGVLVVDRHLCLSMTSEGGS